MSEDARPTVLLAVTHGFAARYLLQTDVLRALQARGARVVVLAPNADEPSMAREYPGVELEPLHADLGRVERGAVHFVVRHARMFALAGRSGAFVNRWEGFEARYRHKNPWMTRAIRALLWLAWRSRAVRRALVAFESRRYAPLINAHAFERWRPDVVATASIGYVREDAAVLREARRRGIPTAGVVMGWDNPTSKGYRGADPDRIIAWSERMAGLVADLQDFPRERIVVAGVPHFDRYVRDGELPSRQELFAQLGLDPARQLILYATSSPGAWTRNADVAETIAAAMDDGRLPDAQLVVRVHPNFFRADTPSSMEAFERVAAHPRVHLDLPDVVAGEMRIRLDREDAVRLGALIRHADVLVNMFSTTTVEACLLDTPVVQVTQHAYDPPDERFISGRREVWPQYIHMRRVVEIGAARTAASPEEIVEHIRAYLDDPALDREARADAARVECGPTDGHAGERVAEMLLGLARKSVTVRERPRVLLVAPNGFAARTLLRTDVLPTLVDGGARVSVLAPEDDALRSELGPRGVALEPLGDTDRLIGASLARRTFTTLRYFTLGDGRHATTLRVKARTALGELAAERPVVARMIGLGVRPLWGSRTLRRALLRLEISSDRADLHADAFARRRPDLVVATTPGLFAADAVVLREARRRGCPTAAVVLGWDNPTAKGYRGADVDLVVAWSTRMAAQLERHHDILPERIAIGGVPHFDRYLRPDGLLPRDELFAALGLDPARHTILFTTPSPDLWNMNATVARALGEAAREGRLGDRTQVVVRPHPNFSLSRAREGVAALQAVAAEDPGVTLFEPALGDGALPIATTPADVDRLAALLAHADVLVNVFSTTTLEAFLVDTPVVALSEDIAGAGNRQRPGGARTWDQFAHLEGLLHGGAARVAHSLEEMVDLVAAYLADPALDRAARRRVAEEECGPLDGRSGERVGRLLLDAVTAPGGHQARV